MRIRLSTLNTPFLMLCTLLMVSCAGDIPVPIREPAASNIIPAEARNRPEQFLGQVVRWGGVIIRTENREQQTRITVLAKPLGRYGEPQEEDVHQGRFIARIDRFLEPTLFAKDRKITVHGAFSGVVNERVGEYIYTYPIVTVDTFYLWPLPSPRYDDYWYDPWYPWYPWYDPWYPYAPYPYYRHPPR